MIDLLRDLPEGAIATREVPGTAWQITTVLPRGDHQWQPLTAALAVLLAGLLAALAAMAVSQQRARRNADQRIKQDLERRVEERAAELVEARSRLEAEMVERRQSEAELSKALDELIQAGKLASMGQAFAGLAHEINQPLAALKTYLSSTKLLIARGDTDSVTANLGIMDETVERLVQLSGDLKHLSRRSDNRLVEVDLAATARRVIGLMRFRIRDAGASVRETLDDGVQVVADQAHIEQIILNLLKNAVDVAADAVCKDIMVQASLQNGMACLSVGDCGPGVPESARGRLFEPFFTTKGVGKGLGLGLAISYAIARDHGGVLRYERTPAGQTWLKAHIGVDLTGLVHTVIGTVANISDVIQAHALLRGQEEWVLGDAGYQGVEKREKNRGLKVHWHIAMRPGKRRALSKGNMGRMLESYERAKASLRACVEHPFRVIKRQFGFTKVRYRGLAKNTAQLKMLFTLANLWKVRHHLMATAG